MSKAGETFFTSVGCMDGRVQDAVANFGRERLRVLFADTISEAGLVGILSKENPDSSLIESLKNKINISLNKHHSRGIIVHGHEECAGNPVDDEKHKEDIKKTVVVLRSFVPKATSILPVFVRRKDGVWIAEEIPMDTV